MKCFSFTRKLPCTNITKRRIWYSCDPGVNARPPTWSLGWRSKIQMFSTQRWLCSLMPIVENCKQWLPSKFTLSMTFLLCLRWRQIFLIIHYNYHHYLLGKLDLKPHFLPCLQLSKTKNKIKVHVEPFRKADPEWQMSHSKSTLPMPIL